MYDQIRGDTLFIILYSMVTAVAMMASGYLLLRRNNAISPDVTSSVRLRRWTGVFFASIALNHVWYMPIFFLSSSEDILMTDLIGGLLDSMTVIPLAIILLFAMLQDRRRPLWPVAVIVAPLVFGKVWCVICRSYAILPILYGYALLMGVGITIYMVRALRQYGRWLLDNFADLAHKEVWQSFMVFAITLLVLGIYSVADSGPAYPYAMLVGCAILICYLLWRVETLSDLSITQPTEQAPQPSRMSLPRTSLLDPSLNLDDTEDCDSPQTIHDKIGPLLQKYCVDTRLYLQHDLTISQLAQTIGTNRLYLSQHFSRLGITYNTYINCLRIQHFMGLYHKAVVSQRSFTARQLAADSGYRNYTTFSAAFKQQKGQTVTAWMHDAANNPTPDFQNQQNIVSKSAKNDSIGT